MARIAMASQDVTDPERGVLPTGRVNLEAPVDALVHELLIHCGWNTDDPWTPLHRDLADPVPDPGVRVEVIGPEQVHVRTAVQRASFDRSTFTDQRWHAMAAGLLEPMGVHRDHRGHGYGRAITVSAAAALQELGSSSAIVCTPSSNAGGVATYLSAGFRALPEVRDRCWEADPSQLRSGSHA
jgi:GNAT superfamily N-acetyltransferase